MTINLDEWNEVIRNPHALGNYQFIEGVYKASLKGAPVIIALMNKGEPAQPELMLDTPKAFEKAYPGLVAMLHKE
jgi:hypothetical protein